MITKDESIFIQAQSRYARLCNMLRWDYDTRHIGRILLIERHGVTISAIAAQTGLRRMTVSRRVKQLIDLGLAQHVDGMFCHTKIGRQFHIMTHRELVRIIAGTQRGFSQKMRAALLQRPGITSEMLDAIAAIRYETGQVPIVLSMDFMAEKSMLKMSSPH